MTIAAVSSSARFNDEPAQLKVLPNRFGEFSPDGQEFRITDPKTPRPWVNVIANPRIGLVVSQTGGGFSWIDNSRLAVITSWHQDLGQDAWGKFIFARDLNSGDVWSLSPAPCWPEFEFFECRHGIGYTVFITERKGIRAEWTLFCHSRLPVELWRIRLKNTTKRPLALELCAYLEWCCGTAPVGSREFQKLFVETEFDPKRRAILARSHMWDVPSEEYGHWNTDFPYVGALATTEAVHSAQGDKAEFVGVYNSLRSPEAMRQDDWTPRFGRHHDPIAALRSRIELDPGATYDLGYQLAAAESKEAVDDLIGPLSTTQAMDRAFAEIQTDWQTRLSDHRVKTPDESIDMLSNDWLRYQAISGRIWGRCGYYQQSGAYGYRDQLQDSQVWLGVDPPQCKAQIRLHAAHQFADGSAYHWWHPLTERGHITRASDTPLWLAFVIVNYLKETDDFGILDERIPFVDGRESATVLEHVSRAFERTFVRTSRRGLPYLGAGDWNDGLSAAGISERGESVWLGHFLAYLLGEWAEIDQRMHLPDRAKAYRQRRNDLVNVINQIAWDGRWYIRATTDDGTILGSAKAARIFRNETWAVLADVAPPDRARMCMDAVREHLVTPAGPLLLTPAFDEPVRKIGYITRYAPGLRENGGVYTHAATWAIAAACKMGDFALVGRLLDAINPTNKDPDRYWAEPYVLPGNVDGPESPYFGRGGWTWYTGSAAWLHRVITHWVLGVRPEWDGLRIAPCLPLGWKRASITRTYRDAEYQIEIERIDGRAQNTAPEVILDGVKLAENLILPDSRRSGRHQVLVRCG